MKKVPTPWKSPLRLALIMAMAVTVIVAAGCAGRFPAERVPRMKWLVLPFEQPATFTTHPRQIKGWWFGAKTIRQNSRAGAMFADTVNSELASLDCVNLYSIIDLKYYFADKERLLEESYNYLDRDQIRALLAEVPNLDYARELGADKLLTGTIIEQRLVENRTIHTWKSIVEVECQVIDVKTGEVEWSKRYRDRDYFASEKTVQEKLVAELVEDLKDEYFMPMIEQ